MKNLIYISLIVCYLSVLCPAGYCSEPVWLDDRYSVLYPKDVYLVGIGKVQIVPEQYPEKKADDSAKSALIDKIRTMMKQTAKDISKDKTSEKITEITNITAKKITRTLLGKVSIGARWIDKKDNSLYSLAVVKHCDLAQDLAIQSSRVNNSAKKYYKIAKKYFKKKKIFPAIENYIQALQLLDEFALYNLLAQSLQDRFDIEEKIEIRQAFVSTGKIEDNIENIISLISLKKIFGDTQEVSSGVLPRHVTVRVLYDTIPVADFPVNFSLPDGNAVYTPNIRSDDKGIVECDISNITEGKKINRVMVAPDLPVDAGWRESSVIKWQKQLAKKQVKFTYFIFVPRGIREWIDDVALSIAKQTEKYGKLSIVVEDFTMSDGSNNKLCTYFPDLLTSQLSAIGREHLTVKRIKDIKKKRKEAVLTGIFTEVGSGVTVSARLDNYKNEYLAGSNITVQRTDEINNSYRPSSVIERKSKKEMEPVERKKIEPKKEEIKEKSPEISEQAEEEEEEPVIRLKKKPKEKVEPATPRKRRRPKIKIIE